MDLQKENLNLLKNINTSNCVLDDDNIFLILNKERDERTHCKILRFLIVKYWESFKQQILCNNFHLEDDLLGNEPECVCEYHIGKFGNCTENKEGSIDILIITKGYIIPIEVKVDAGDQKIQLLRYYNYFKHNYNKKLLLIYFTPNGKEASPYSLECNHRNIKNAQCIACENITKKHYKRISYKQIAEWLNTIPKNHNQASVYIAECYKQLLNKEHIAMENIDILLDKKENFELAKAVSESYQKAIEKIKTEFFKTLKNKLEEEYKKFNSDIEIIDSNNPKGKNIEEIDDYKNMQFAIYENNILKFSVCVETNLYLRIFNNVDKNSSWVYIYKEWFNNRDIFYYQTTEKGKDKNKIIDARTFDGNDNAIINWYFSNEKEKQIDNLIKHIQVAVGNNLNI